MSRPAEATELDEALARAGDGVFVIGPDARIVLWNRAAEKLTGYTAREVIGRSCCDVLSGHDDDGNRLCYQGCHVMSLVKMGEPVQHFDMRTRNKAGRPMWINVSVLHTSSEGNGNGGNGGNGGANGGARSRPLTVHIFRDVTAVKELLTLVHERLAAPPPGSDPPEPAGSLSRRELEVLRLMMQGLNTAGAAERLHVSPATIRNHVQNIFGKLGVHSRLEAVAYATRHRLL
jgi:PAS domain S-box-containing protein